MQLPLYGTEPFMAEILTPSPALCLLCPAWARFLSRFSDPARFRPILDEARPGNYVISISNLYNMHKREFKMWRTALTTVCNVHCY